MINILRRYLSDTSGATAVEYGLLVGILSTTFLFGNIAVGNALDNIFHHLANTIQESKLPD